MVSSAPSLRKVRPAISFCAGGVVVNGSGSVTAMYDCISGS